MCVCWGYGLGLPRFCPGHAERRLAGASHPQVEGGPGLEVLKAHGHEGNVAAVPGVCEAEARALVSRWGRGRGRGEGGEAKKGSQGLRTAQAMAPEVGRLGLGGGGGAGRQVKAGALSRPRNSPATPSVGPGDLGKGRARG